MKNLNELLILKSEINEDIKAIELICGNVKEKYANLSKEKLDYFNISGFGYLLHNFYNGIENIMKRAAKEYYGKMPNGDIWHKQLLQLSSVTNGKKAALFTKNIVDELYNYLSFRHVFIHGYGFTLSWDKMKILADNVDELWQGLKHQIAEFIKAI